MRAVPDCRACCGLPVTFHRVVAWGLWLPTLGSLVSVCHRDASGPEPEVGVGSGLEVKGERKEGLRGRRWNRGFSVMTSGRRLVVGCALSSVLLIVVKLVGF